MTQEMADKANELKDAVSIYNFVYNNIRSEFYNGSRKGAIGTFEQGSGNDLDIASLLIAMLRYEAKKRLPSMVKDIADANGFEYSTIKINSAKTRWGSCSSKGSLNFSLFLMLMPLHLIRSVVVHELCHTIHMDHSANFWALFDKVYGVSHKIVDKEIRELKMPVFLRS